MGVIVCSVKEAFELMKHMDENDMFVLTIIDKRTYSHNTQKKILFIAYYFHNWNKITNVFSKNMFDK